MIGLAKWAIQNDLKIPNVNWLIVTTWERQMQQWVHIQTVL